MGSGKKKVDTELRTYFPGWFGDDVEFLDQLRQYYILRVEVEERGEEKDIKALEEIYKWFMNQNLPMCFNPYDERSVLISGDREFEEICNSMEDSGAKNVRESTVFEFYSKITYLENKVKRLKHHATT